jgi:hypothetical protein
MVSLIPVEKKQEKKIKMGNVGISLIDKKVNTVAARFPRIPKLISEQGGRMILCEKSCPKCASPIYFLSKLIK